LLDRLAGLYRQTGNQAEAIRIYENLANTYGALPAPAFQNSKWLEATKNLIAANVEAKKTKEATALYDKAVAKIHSSARKDTPSEVSLMRAYSAALRKENRAKEADSIENRAKRVEQSLGGR
jgi:tetratricopeptide (TPR) repeat protein